MSEGLVLAGDIGGTKSNLAFFCGAPGAPESVAERTYRNREFAGLAEVVRRFVSDAGLASESACFGVAGAVVGGESHLPNLGWRLSERTLARDLGLKSVRLVNDLEANALGIDTLAPEQFFILNPGQPCPGGNRALIAAGTGLGMATLVPDGAGWRVAASEGGHADFPPRDEEEIALLRFLKERHRHVSLERVVSGPGLADIYEFLRHAGMTEPDALAARLAVSADRTAVIAEAGLAEAPEICVKALDMFFSAYGAAAGNLALTALATDGLYVGGGIAPKLLQKFPRSGFMAAFVDKGRFADLLGQMPVRIILESKTALYGAAARALRHDSRSAQ